MGLYTDLKNAGLLGPVKQPMSSRRTGRGRFSGDTW